MKLLAAITTFTLSLVIAYPGAVVALPSPQIGSNSECSTGSMHCCNSVEPANSDKLAPILDALQLNVPSDQHVGLSCTPIPVGSVGGGPSW